MALPNPRASVVIPVFNARSHVEKCLISLRAQTLDPIEIIFIDDGSTDGTVKYLQEQEGITLLKQAHQGPGPARNLGVSHTKSEIIVFLDADMVCEPDFLEKLIAPIESGRVRGTFTKEEYVANWDNSWARLWNFEYTGKLDSRRLPLDFPDEALVFRAVLKEEFERVGGFDSVGYTDDWTLSQKLGYKSQAAPGAIMYHTNPSSISEIFNQAQWIGKRQYKGGQVGRIFALFRANILVSIFVGITRSLSLADVRYFLFKIVYDLGIVTGILSVWTGASHAK